MRYHSNIKRKKRRKDSCFSLAPSQILTIYNSEREWHSCTLQCIFHYVFSKSAYSKSTYFLKRFLLLSFFGKDLRVQIITLTVPENLRKSFFSNSRFSGRMYRPLSINTVIGYECNSNLLYRAHIMVGWL